MVSNNLGSREHTPGFPLPHGSMTALTELGRFGRSSNEHLRIELLIKMEQFLNTDNLRNIMWKRAPLLNCAFRSKKSLALQLTIARLWPMG